MLYSKKVIITSFFICFHLSGEICVSISLESAGATRSWSDDLAAELSDIERDYSLSSQSTAPSIALAYRETETCKEDSINEYSDGSEIPAEDKCSEVTNRNQAAAEDRSKGDSYAALNGTETSSFKTDKPSFVDRVCQIFARKNGDVVPPSSGSSEASEEVQEEPGGLEIPVSQNDNACPEATYSELLKSLESRHEGVEMPVNLQGILVNQSYLASPSDLNNLLFSPDSDFKQAMIELQGCTDFKTEPWRLDSDGESLKRVVTYTTAPSKLVKAVRATEEQSYLKADGKEYAVLLSVSTPDVPCGTYFRTEVLFRIMPGPELDSQQQTSHLVISWRMNFLQSTMMKGIIENGARQGLEQNYAQFSELLSEKIKPIDVEGSGSDKDQVLASLQGGQESDWKIAFLYFCNFGVLSSLFVFIYVVLHVLQVTSSSVQGLEFPGLDLPDSLSEIIMGGLLFLQVQNILKKTTCFVQARGQKGKLFFLPSSVPSHDISSMKNQNKVLKLLVGGRSSGTIDFSLKISVNKTMTLNLSEISLFLKLALLWLAT